MALSHKLLSFHVELPKIQCIDNIYYTGNVKGTIQYLQGSLKISLILSSLPSMFFASCSVHYYISPYHSGISNPNLFLLELT